MMSLLRVLTPEEINELTTTSDGHNRVSLTQLMYHKMGVETQAELEQSSLAKILPFTYPTPEKEDVVAPEGPVRQAGAQVEQAPIVEKPIAPQIKKETVANLAPPLAPSVQGEALVAEGRLATSVFILHEKRKIEATVQKMRSRELMASYKKNAAVEIHHYSKEAKEEEPQHSSLTGILVNKKQA